jgi:dTMP kinase
MPATPSDSPTPAGQQPDDPPLNPASADPTPSSDPNDVPTDIGLPAGANDSATLPGWVPPGVVPEADRPSLHVRLFGSHMFFRLWLAQVVSSVGDWLGFLAITILAARVGGRSSSAAVGFVMAARIAPGFFLAPVAGVLIDRWDRKKVMVVCDLGRAAVVASLPFVDTVLGLVLASLVLEIFTLMWSPAKEASVPNIVPADRLTSANSLSLGAAYGSFPVAAPVFAVLATLSTSLGHISVLHPFRINQSSLAFYVDVATFLTSAAMISTLKLPPSARRPRRAAGRIDWGQTYHELREGWSYIFVTPVVLAVNVGLATGLIGGGMVVPLGALFSTEVLGAGAAGFGVFVTALGFGTAAGVIAVSLFQKRLPKADMFTLSLFGAGACLILAAFASSLAPAAVAVALLGVFAGSVYVLGFTLLHESVSDELRGRIFSALYSIVRICLLLALTLGPFLSELLDRLSGRWLNGRRPSIFGWEVYLPGVRLTLWLAGGIILCAGVLALRTLRRPAVNGAAAPLPP